MPWASAGWRWRSTTRRSPAIQAMTWDGALRHPQAAWLSCGSPPDLDSTPCSWGLKARRPSTISPRDRKSTRLNSSHSQISYAVFCLKKKKEKQRTERRVAFDQGPSPPKSQKAHVTLLCNSSLQHDALGISDGFLAYYTGICDRARD